MIKKFINASILFFWINFAVALIPASIDRNSVNIGDTITLNIDVSHVSDTPQIDVLQNNFEIVGTSTNSQMSVINGHMSSQKSFMVTITPKNLGAQQIPAIKVGSDTTSPIGINVSKAPERVVPRETKDAQVFIDVNIDKTTSYLNVPIIYDLKIYFFPLFFTS